MDVQIPAPKLMELQRGRDGTRTRRTRNRRVRLRYPAALVELALLLCGTIGVPRVASGLGLGKSTVYRWTSAHRTAWMSAIHWTRAVVHSRENDVITELLSRCARAGFHVRSSLLSADADSKVAESEESISNER